MHAAVDVEKWQHFESRRSFLGILRCGSEKLSRLCSGKLDRVLLLLETNNISHLGAYFFGLDYPFSVLTALSSTRLFPTLFYPLECPDFFIFIADYCPVIMSFGYVILLTEFPTKAKWMERPNTSEVERNNDRENCHI